MLKSLQVVEQRSLLSAPPASRTPQLRSLLMICIEYRVALQFRSFMAQPVVSCVVNKLRSYLHREVPLLGGLLGDVEWMEEELRKLLPFLDDAHSGDRQDWVDAVLQIAHGAEDVIDRFLLRSEVFPRSLDSAAARRHFCNQVGDIKKRITEASSQVLPLPGEPTSSSWRNSNAFGNAADENGDDNDAVVGFEEAQSSAISQLLNPADRFDVVAILGAGGAGKTTLARAVYSSSDIVGHFVARGWVLVNSESSVTAILKKTIRELAGKASPEAVSDRSRRIIGELRDEHAGGLSWGQEELKWALHELLNSRGRCLIVLDNVERKDVWEKIRTAFVAAVNGSRAVVTTRSADVARSADPYASPLELRPLGISDSCALLARNIFGDHRVFPSELAEVGRAVAARCGGLPLSLVLAGGLLSTKEKTHDAWSDVAAALGSSESAVALCYSELPRDLKPCFLYLGAFPQGGEINARQLLRLWVAEYLVPFEEDEEAAGETILEELTRRRLVRVTKRWCTGEASRITVHDIVHSFCVGEAGKFGFLRVELGSSVAAAVSSATTRVAFADGIPTGYIDHRSAGRLRTLSLRAAMVFGSSGLEHRLGDHLSGLKLLTVIHVEGGRRLTTIPVEVSAMVHLRYLRWIVHSGHGLLAVPSLHSLRRLRTLDTNAELSSECGIGSLAELRCLMHVKLGRLAALQLFRLPKLKTAEVVLIGETVKLNPFERHRSLERLSMRCSDGAVVPREALTAFPSLRQLRLSGELQPRRKLPSALPPELAEVALCGTRLQEDPMPALELLPKLACLSLERQSFEGTAMRCSSGGFPQLRRLELRGLEKLEELVVEDGAMPALETAAVDGCRKLRSVPLFVDLVKIT